MTRCVFVCLSAVGLGISAEGCAARVARESWYPIPEQAPPTGAVPDVRGTDAAAAAVPSSQQIEILREVVRGFFRPSMGAVRWIDPRPLSHRRADSGDTLVKADYDWGAAIVSAVGLRRVCLLDESDGDCRGRAGGVLRLSTPYADGRDSAVVFVRYSGVAKGELPMPAAGFELEFHLLRRDSTWRIVSRQTIAGPLSNEKDR
jgi:hypothetical protein